MARVLLTALADADSADILVYLSEAAGYRIAERYAADFDRLYGLLARFPKSGAPRPALGPRVRIGVVFPCLVIYEHVESDDMVMVLRILHGHRRVTMDVLGSSGG